MKDNLGLEAGDRGLLSRETERRVATVPSHHFLKATRSTLVRTAVQVNGESIEPAKEPPGTRA